MYIAEVAQSLKCSSYGFPHSTPPKYDEGQEAMRVIWAQEDLYFKKPYSGALQIVKIRVQRSEMPSMLWK